MSRTRFRPETDGYAFSNTWMWDDTEKATVTQVVTDALAAVEIVLSPLILAAGGPVLVAEAGVPFIGPWLVYETVKAANDAIVNQIANAIETSNGGIYGLCGGMAFSSCDYFLKGWIVPRGTGPNDQPQRTTPEGTVLRDYIWSRLLKSVQDNAATFLQWMGVFHFGGDGGRAWLKGNSLAQLATLKARIDGGTPVPIGLIGTTWSPFDNHQVLVYGYQDNPNGTTTLFIYDNNVPDTESTTVLDFSGPDLVATESAADAARGPLQGFFCTTYGPQVPPKAVVLGAGLTLSPAVQEVGRPVGVQFTAANVGYHASPAFQLVAADNGGNLAEEGGANAIDQGSTRTLNSQLVFDSAGSHTVRVFADLGVHSGIHVVKQLPVEGSTQTPIQTELVLDHRNIRSVTDTQCQVTNQAGTQASFTVDTADMGSGLTYQWTASGGASPVGNATSSIFTVQLPAAVGDAVTIGVRVTRPDGVFTTGQDTFTTISAQAAGLQEVLCEIEHILTKAPFSGIPIGPDPGPDGGVIAPDPAVIASLGPTALASLRTAAAGVVTAVDAAIKTNATVVMRPGIRSTAVDAAATAAIAKVAPIGATAVTSVLGTAR
ncbi:hypothetical protein [Burkholderia sp. Bp8998]|uniref:hypothetical protein n=1 Tax=Burkholderia sp. Bp8998 TaxID=2184557 RepID=UPI000F591193|nr:hypothetical protein [Burkholderia sp. Bp8998]